MKEEQILQLFMQVLSDANRLKIVRFIADEEKSVSEIVENMRLSQPLVSHHLRALRDQNILVTRRQGPFIFYSLSDTRLLDALSLLLELACP